MLHSTFQHAARMSARTILNRSTNKASVGARRFASNDPYFVQLAKEQNTKDFYKVTWLSDPSTYPIMLVLGGALSMMTGVIVYNFACNPDCRINPNTRGSIIQPK